MTRICRVLHIIEVPVRTSTDDDLAARWQQLTAEWDSAAEALRKEEAATVRRPDQLAQAQARLEVIKRELDGVVAAGRERRRGAPGPS